MRMPIVIAVGFAIVVALEALYYGVRHTFSQRSETLKRRLRAVTHAEGERTSLLRPGRFAASPGLDAVLRNIPLAKTSERLLEAADSNLTVARLWGWSAAIAVAALLTAVSLHLALLPTLLLVGLGPLSPTIVLMGNARRRSNQLSEQLPEALDMMARSLRAGHAISGALELVATEMPHPVGLEFGRVFEEQRLGLPLEEAIVHMTKRLPANRDVKIVAVSVIIQRETGGNMAEILTGIAETIRARYRFEGKLRGITAEGRASALVLGLLPLAFAALLQVIHPRYLDPLFESPTGKAALAYAIVSWALGLFTLHRMAKVEF